MAVLFGGGYLLFRPSKLPAAPPAVSAPPAPPAPAPEQPAVDVTAAQLWNAYQANVLAADELYLGRPLAVTAIVEAIDKSFGGEPLLVLGAPHRQTILVRLDASQVGRAAKLKRSSIVVLLCRGGGRSGGEIRLHDCVLQ